LTHEEFKKKRLGLKKTTSHRVFASLYFGKQMKRGHTALPASVDWRAQGYVTPVKDQGDCGCCWAFSTTGLLEGAYFKKNKKLVSLSEEDLVECEPDFAGCDGGIPTYAVAYVKSKRGIATEASYPYTASDGQSFSDTCQESSATKEAMTPVVIPIGRDDTHLMTAVSQYGPISVAIAVGEPMKQYESGIIDPNTACESDINHAVLLTGYGTDPATGKKYWIVKNSWNTDWGEEGYFRLSRDVSNSCGITEQSVAATV